MSQDGTAIAKALDGVAARLSDLGNGDAATPMGAIEAHGLVFKDGLCDHVLALDRLTEAISTAGVVIAEALVKAARIRAGEE